MSSSRIRDLPAIRDRIVGLRRVRGGDLLVNPKNWRQHPKSQQDALKGVLAEIGYADALLARETPDGLMLIDGHLRAGISRNQEVPVLVLDLDEQEADKLLATLDPLAAMAQPNQDALLSLLVSVQFESQAVNAMLEALANGETQPLPTPGLTDPDDVPEVSSESWVKRGDLFQLGEHRVMCGDSTKDCGGLIAEGTAEVMWTDPPYGVSYVGKTKDALRIENDDADGLDSLLAETFAAANVALAPGCRIYLAAPPGPLNLTFRLAFINAGWRFHEGLVWCKDSMVLGHSDYHLQHEDILYGWKPGPGRVGRGNHEGTRWYGDHSQVSVFHIARSKRSTEHPTMKPVELVVQHLENSSRTGDAILDPFLGSGTTLIACEKLGRICYGMEIEPRYVQVALERWQNYTGRQAVKLG